MFRPRRRPSRSTLLTPVASALIASCSGPPAGRTAQREPATATAPAPEPACSARIDRNPVDGVFYRDWLEAWRALAATADGGAPAPPASAAEAYEDLCPECGRPDDLAPKVVATGDSTEQSFHLAVPSRDGLLVFANIGRGTGGRCGTKDDISIEAGPPFHVQAVSVVDDLVDVEDGGEACFAIGSTTTDYFFDLPGRRRILAVTREAVTDDPNRKDLVSADWRLTVTLEVGPGGVHLGGDHCDVTLPLAVAKE